LDIKLDESPCELFAFPRSRRLAGAQPNDRIVQSDRLARLHPNIARDAVALVENAENGDAIRHRSDPGLLPRPRVRTRPDGVVGLICSLILFAPAPGR
jgi:hypothetical protein